MSYPLNRPSVLVAENAVKMLCKIVS
jgi:hypothetical protein